MDACVCPVLLAYPKFTHAPRLLNVSFRLLRGRKSIMLLAVKALRLCVVDLGVYRLNLACKASYVDLR